VDGSARNLVVTGVSNGESKESKAYGQGTDKFIVDILGYIRIDSGFGGLEVACWPLVPDFAGSNPAEAIGVFGRKNPQHAFLRRGSKAVYPMSCFTACKRTQK
jgi:hypothetical protein